MWDQLIKIYQHIQRKRKSNRSYMIGHNTNEDNADSGLGSV